MTKQATKRAKPKRDAKPRRRLARYGGKRWDVVKKSESGKYVLLTRFAGNVPYAQWAPVACVAASDYALGG